MFLYVGHAIPSIERSEKNPFILKKFIYSVSKK